MDETSRKWNSLEIAKIAISVLTPLALLWLGIQFNNTAARNAQIHEREAQVIRKRIELWDKMGRPINDIYIFRMGSPTDLTEAAITKEREDLNILVYSYRPFFTDEFVHNYAHFMDVTSKDYFQHQVPQDKENKVREAYFGLMEGVGKELDVVISPASPTPAPSATH